MISLKRNSKKQLVEATGIRTRKSSIYNPGQSEDFKISEKQKTTDGSEEIEDLKIIVRPLNKEDIKNRKLPNQTTGLVITGIKNNSPLSGSIEVNSIIVEAQKKRIKTIADLKQITNQVLNSNQKTILLAIYNNQNQRRYIGIKLD